MHAHGGIFISYRKERLSFDLAAINKIIQRR